MSDTRTLDFVDSIWPRIDENVRLSMFNFDTSKKGVEGGLKLAADVAVSAWRDAHDAELAALRQELAEARAALTGTVTWGVRYSLDGDPYDESFDSEGAAREDIEMYGGELINRQGGRWTVTA